LEKGVKINYSLGKEWSDESFLPDMITRERMEDDILAKIEDESDRELFLKNYPLITMEEREERPYKDLRKLDSGVAIDDLFGNYEFVVLDSPQERIEPEEEDPTEYITDYFDLFLGNLYEVENQRELESHHFDNLRENEVYVLYDAHGRGVANWDIDDMIAILKDIGYTPEDAQEAHLENGIDPPEANPEVFDIPLQYELDGRSLIVSIAGEEIYYPQDVMYQGEEQSHYLSSLQLLNFFEAANREDEGYMFVPDGSGAIINLNNDKTDAARYKSKVYGENYAQTPPEKKLNPSRNVKLPVFGLKKEQSSFFAIIEGGSTLGSIVADISGKDSSYNRVFTEFEILPRGHTYLGMEGEDQTEFPVYAPQNYQGDYQVRYTFLDKEEADYSGMANLYRDYLENKYDLSRIEPEEDIPFYLDLVGSIQEVRSILGIPRDVTLPLTSFMESKSIIDKLHSENVNNINLRYRGWMEGGLQHSFSDRVKLISEIGTQSELNDLKDYLQDKNVNFFPEVNFMNVHHNEAKDINNFNRRNDAVRFLNEDIISKYWYNQATYRQDDDYAWYLLTPDKIPSVIDSFMADYDDYELSNLALTNLGNQLYSDYGSNNYHSREESLSINEKAAKRLAEDYDKELMFNQANEYVLPYTKNILNLSSRDSEFRIVDRSVPFYQMTVHGYANYADRPLNKMGDLNKEKLKALETGQLPYYRWIYREDENIKETDSEYLLAMKYENWLEEAVEFYSEVNPVLSEVQGKFMEEHQKLADNVFLTRYENGPVIIVNYNDQAVEIKGELIEANDYQVLGEEEADGLY
ncbi:MAG: DUF5696 domain-containing protein, partial [bacterium]